MPLADAASDRLAWCHIHSKWRILKEKRKHSTNEFHIATNFIPCTKYIFHTEIVLWRKYCYFWYPQWLNPCRVKYDLFITNVNVSLSRTVHFKWFHSSWRKVILTFCNYLSYSWATFHLVIVREVGLKSGYVNKFDPALLWIHWIGNNCCVRSFFLCALIKQKQKQN